MKKFLLFSALGFLLVSCGDKTSLPDTQKQEDQQGVSSQSEAPAVNGSQF